MRLLLTLLTLLQLGLPFPGPGSPHSSATVTLVQQKSDGVVSGTLNITPPSNVTSGDFLIVICGYWSGNGVSTFNVTDTLANTWTNRGVTGLNTSNFSSEAVIFTAVASSTGTDTNVTCTQAFDGHIDATFMEYSGATALDSGATDCNNNNSATTGVTHSVTSTATDTLVTFTFVAATSSSTLTTPTNYTLRVTGTGTSGDTFKAFDRSAVAAGAQSVSNVGSGTTPLHSCLIGIHP